MITAAGGGETCCGATISRSIETGGGSGDAGSVAVVDDETGGSGDPKSKANDSPGFFGGVGFLLRC
jgi:hypothetical protein